eukprot:COSAG06_NODE_2827_length_6216_cov_1.565310_4_plen_296_part_00
MAPMARPSRRRLGHLHGHLSTVTTEPEPTAAVDSRLSAAVTGTSALGPDPWTNTPDGEGTGGGPLPPRLTMTDEELYLFDIHGYSACHRQQMSASCLVCDSVVPAVCSHVYRTDAVVVPSVLSQETLASLNRHIDANAAAVRVSDGGSLDGTDTPIHGGLAAPAMTGSHTRGDFGGFLWDWGEPAGAEFRALMANEHAMRIVMGVIGDAFRLAGVSGLSQTKGAEGFVLHGGGNPDNMFPTMRERDFHRWEPTPTGGRMRNGLLRVGFALSDSLLEEDGGFCCVPGSHKAMYLRR